MTIFPDKGVTVEYLTITDMKEDGSKEYWGFGHSFSGNYAKAIKILSPVVAKEELKKAKQLASERNLSIEQHLTKVKEIA